MKLILLVIAGLSAASGANAAAPATPNNPHYHMVGTVPVPDGAFQNAVIDPQTRQMLIAQQSGITAFDLDLQTIRGGFVAGADVTSVAALGATGQGAATDRSGTVVLFDGQTGKPSKSIRVGGALLGSVFDAKSGFLVVIGAAAATVIDPLKRAAVGTIPLEGASTATAGNAAGQVYVGAQDGTRIDVLDPSTRAASQHLKLTGCSAVVGIAYASDTDSLIVACANSGVKFIAATSGEELGSGTAGKSAGQVLFDHDRHMAVVPGSADGSLSVFALDDRGGGQLVQTVAVPNGIRGGVIDQVTGRIFLLVPGSGPGGNRILVVDPV